MSGSAPIEGTGAGQGRDQPWDDGKDPGALRTIGEVGQALGIRQHVLRYWEEQFPMLRPLKRSGGRRYYRPDDIALVRRIDRLVHHEGYTLRGARAVLEGGTGQASAPGAVAVPADAGPPAPDAAGAVPALGPATRARLQAIRARLAAALAD